MKKKTAIVIAAAALLTAAQSAQAHERHHRHSVRHIGYRHARHRVVEAHHQPSWGNGFAWQPATGESFGMNWQGYAQNSYREQPASQHRAAQNGWGKAENNNFVGSAYDGEHRERVAYRNERRVRRRIDYRDYRTAAYANERSYGRRVAFDGGGRHGSDPRPAAWCGWEMRRLVGSDPGRAYNLARNWAHWGHAGPAGVGAVVVWAHHVGKIVGRANGEWVIESGNDGHALRTRPRSISGAIAIRWS